MKEWLLRWGPALLMMILIFGASASPGTDLPKFGAWDFFVKKGGHMLGYAMLAAAYYHALNNGKGITRGHLIMVACLTVLYAISDEAHQRFTPGRSPSISDVFIDASGSVIGLALWSLLGSKILYQRRPAKN
jgi:VanZ family protein